MSIDARVAGVTVISPSHCDACSGSGHADGDVCGVCYGATVDAPRVVLRLEPRKSGTLAGQSSLTIVNPPSVDPKILASMIGTEIWGGSGDIMVGQRRWAKRIGYTQIELVEA